MTSLSLTLFGQGLKCCESENEIETYLSGNWKMKDSDLKHQYSYEFNKGFGKFRIYLIKENGSLYEIKENQPAIKILKTKKGFEIDYNYGVLKTSAGIRHLDSTKLVLTRRDGVEREYYKISD